MSLPASFLNQNIETSQGDGPRTDKGEPSIPNMAEDAPDPTPEPSGNDSGRASSPQSGDRGPPATKSSDSDNSKATDAIKNLTDSIPGSGEQIGPDDVKDAFDSAEEQFSKQLDSQVNELEQQFTDRIEQTQEGFNSQIDELAKGVSQVNSNVQDNISGLAEGIGNTQNAIGSIPSTISDILEQQSGDEESDGIGSQTLLIGAAAVIAAIVFTQMD